MRKGGMKGISVKEQIEEVLKKKVKIKEEIFYDIADGLVKEFTNILMNQFPYEQQTHTNRKNIKKLKTNYLNNFKMNFGWNSQ